MKNFLEKLFGDDSQREMKKMKTRVEAIQELADEYRELPDEKLRGKTSEFKNRLEQGETLDDLLPEAFATVREASTRVLGLTHYEVQLYGGIVLHEGRIAEMKTGEGKTLVAPLAVYLNALEGKGVHVVTVNDYLAQRDRDWMGKLYEYLGLTIGVIVHGQDKAFRKEQYACDITYGTNNEFGFDYLRDNMVIYKDQMVQRDLHYAIIDEVDSILIDEARTPLIISGRGDKATTIYGAANQFVKSLKDEADYSLEEKAKSVTLTEEGLEKAERSFGIDNLSDPEHMELAHHINQALKAKTMMKRDRDYVVKDGEVIIVDDFTGRLMPGRRYSDGLHQAIEAKEGIEVKRESKTLASITFQNYFRMYNKLAGMTGTAKTEENEFLTIYGMDVVEIPTNQPVVREDHADVIYKSVEGKINAIIGEITELHKKGQPILVGTISIENSELLSKRLKKKGVDHEVLNAKHHDREAEIVAQAGRQNAVTIATNMAGRGTDIILGGNPEFLAMKDMRKEGYSDEVLRKITGAEEIIDPELKEVKAVLDRYLEDHKKTTDYENKEVIKAGGLHIVGTERHESRRIDNQLRGRAGRQGDPGSSRFFLSLEDDLMRLFGGERMFNLVDKLGIEEDQPIEHKMLTNSIENAQKKVEGKNFSIRKHVLQYDDVMNKQREVIYKQRRQVLEGEDMKEQIMGMVESIVDYAVELYTADGQFPEEWDLDGLKDYLYGQFLPKNTLEFGDIEELDRDRLRTIVMETANRVYEKKEEEIGEERMREIERVILLRIIDQKWMDHIDVMDHFKQGINLRAIGQEDPVRAFQKEGFEMFQYMVQTIREDTVKYLYRIEKETVLERKAVADPNSTTRGRPKVKTVVKGEQVGRNEPCPCGSGKKYKKCHGA